MLASIKTFPKWGNSFLQILCSKLCKVVELLLLAKSMICCGFSWNEAFFATFCLKVAQTTAWPYFLLTLRLYSRKICRYDFPIKFLKYNEPDNKHLRVNFRQNFGMSDIKFWVECLLLKIALVDDGERKVEFNTEKYSLLRSRFLGCHATLPSKKKFLLGGALRDIQRNGKIMHNWNSNWTKCWRFFKFYFNSMPSTIATNQKAQFSKDTTSLIKPNTNQNTPIISIRLSGVILLKTTIVSSQKQSYCP